MLLLLSAWRGICGWRIEARMSLQILIKLFVGIYTSPKLVWPPLPQIVSFYTLSINTYWQQELFMVLAGASTFVLPLSPGINTYWQIPRYVVGTALGIFTYSRGRLGINTYLRASVCSLVTIYGFHNKSLHYLWIMLYYKYKYFILVLLMVWLSINTYKIIYKFYLFMLVLHKGSLCIFWYSTCVLLLLYVTLYHLIQYICTTSKALGWQPPSSVAWAVLN